MELSRGQIVKSLTGRDKGRYFIVLEAQGEFVFLADGKLRKLEHPKCKKLKHIQITKTIVPCVEPLTDKQLRKLLHEYNYPECSAAAGR